MRKEHYNITEFNNRRLSRGESYCYRADVYVNSEKVDWVWLSKQCLKDIMNDSRCSISKDKDVYTPEELNIKEIK